MSQIIVTGSGGGGGGTLSTLTGNTGGAISPTAGNINIVGTGNISVAGSGSTLTITDSTGAGITGIAGDTGTTQTGPTVTFTGGTTGLSFGSATNTETLSGTLVVSNGGTGVTSLTSNGVLIGNGTSGITVTAEGATGQVLTGVTGADPVWASPASTIYPWTVVTGTTQSLAINNGYIANNAGLVTMTLPSTAAVGSTIRVTGMNNATGWKVAQNASQQIFISTVNTTSGTGGSLASSATRDSITLLCIVADTTWNAIEVVGNITYV